MKKQNLLYLILQLFPFMLFAGNIYEVRGLNLNPYISARDMSMFVLVGNSLDIRDFSNDDALFDEFLNFPKADIKIRSDGCEKSLNLSQKKALAVALLRLVVKNPNYVCDAGFYESFELIVNEGQYKIDLADAYSFVKIDKTKNVSKRTLFPRKGSYVSKEFCILIKSFFDDVGVYSHSDNSHERCGEIFAPMTLFSEKELAEIFDFIESFFGHDVFIAYEKQNYRNKNFFEPTLEGKHLHLLSDSRKKSMMLSMARSAFITDSLTSNRIHPKDKCEEFAPILHEGHRFYILYNDKKNVFSMDFDACPMTFQNAPASILLMKYELKNATMFASKKKGDFPPLFNPPETFFREFSYFSPELYFVLNNMLNNIK